VRLLEKALRQAVDEYLGGCEKHGREPQKPFKGSFNVRIVAELHRQAMIVAGEQSLNAFVCDAIQEKVAKSQARASH
jgi:predicted HicB family RNase H-like nuclease